MVNVDMDLLGFGCVWADGCFVATYGPLEFKIQRGKKGRTQPFGFLDW